MTEQLVWTDSVDIEWADDVIRRMEHIAQQHCAYKGLVYTKINQRYEANERSLRVDWTIDV